MNAKSECPDRYKSSVIVGGIRREHKICSSQDLLNNELKRLRQILVNNGYTNTNFDHELDKFLHRTDSQQATENYHKIKIHYKNLMSTAYKIVQFEELKKVKIEVKCNLKSRASRKSIRTHPVGRNKEQCCNRLQTPNYGT